MNEKETIEEILQEIYDSGTNFCIMGVANGGIQIFETWAVGKEDRSLSYHPNNPAKAIREAYAMLKLKWKKLEEEKEKALKKYEIVLKSVTENEDDHEKQYIVGDHYIRDKIRCTFFRHGKAVGEIPDNIIHEINDIGYDDSPKNKLLKELGVTENDIIKESEE